MKKFIIRIFNLNENNIITDIVEHNFQGTKKEAAIQANKLAMEKAIYFKDHEIFYSIYLNGGMIRKGRIVPKITYRYVVDFKG